MMIKLDETVKQPEEFVMCAPDPDICLTSESRAHSEDLVETADERRLLSVGGTTGIGAGVASDEDGDGVPIIDLAQPAEVVEEELWKAANDVGFFTVINHGIPQEVIDGMFEQAVTFFDQTVSEKKEQCPFDRALNSGYEFKEQIRPSSGRPDQKESYHISPRAGAMDDRWPTKPATLRGFAETTMIPEAHQLSMRILSSLERRGCTHLEPGTLEQAITLWGEHSRSCLRILRYPPMTIEENEEMQVPGNVHWRAAPHTDFSCLTLLFQREGEGGLECRANPRSAVGSGDEAKWLPVHPVKGGISVNIGDMLSHWSDGELFANLHRVRMPRDASECAKSRYSIAYFTQADDSHELLSKNGDTITAGDYIKMRLKTNFK